MLKKTVIDCNIIISALINDGRCRRVIREILEKHNNYISKEILMEYKAVISRPKLKVYKDIAVKLLEIICRESVLVDIEDIENFNLPDKKAEIYLKTAFKADADVLITGNLKDFPKKKYHKLAVISASDFLK